MSIFFLKICLAFILKIISIFLAELTENISRTKDNTADLLKHLENPALEPEVQEALKELMKQVEKFHVTCINEIQKHSV